MGAKAGMNGGGSRSEKRPVCQRLANPAFGLRENLRKVAEKRRACEGETAKIGLSGADEMIRRKDRGKTMAWKKGMK